MYSHLNQSFFGIFTFLSSELVIFLLRFGKARQIILPIILFTKTCADEKPACALFLKDMQYKKMIF